MRTAISAEVPTLGLSLELYLPPGSPHRWLVAELCLSLGLHIDKQVTNKRRELMESQLLAGRFVR